MARQRLEVSRLLNLLFQTAKKEDGRNYTAAEVSRSIGMTESTMATLRSGESLSPQLDTLTPLADFFKVPLDYFNVESEEEALGIIAQSRGTLPKLENWAFRFGQLPEAAQQDLWRMIEWIERAEAIRQGAIVLKPDN